MTDEASGAIGSWDGVPISTIRLLFEGGRSEVEVGPDDPTATTFRRAIVEGKPTGSWSAIVLSAPDGTPLFFGTFVRTQQGRILFCPAAQAVVGDAPADEFRGVGVDHITLDNPVKPGRHRSHITFHDNPHGIAATTFPVDGHLLPWFSLLMNGLTGLSVLPSVLKITFDPPRIDGSYPQDLIGEFKGLVSMPVPEEGPQPNFLQLDVWAGMTPSWRSESLLDVMPWVFQDGVADEVPAEQQAKCLRQEVELAEDRGVVLVLSRVQGRLVGANRVLRPGRWRPI